MSPMNQETHAAPALKAGIAALLACLLVAAGPARADKSDRSKPIHLEADRVTVDDVKQVATFEGNVVLTQGTLVIRGDKMVVHQDSAGFKSGTTWGDLAYFRQKREGYDEYIEGWAERIEYDGRADKVQMFDRASMKRGEDTVRGHYISYDAKTEFFRVLGGKPSAPSGGRVHAVIQPKPKEGQAPKPPVKLKPTDEAGAVQRRPGVNSQ